MNELVRIEGFSKHFKDFSLEIDDFVVPCGSVVGLIGSNGAGKSTLIKAILGITPSFDGSVQVFGEDIATMNPSQLAKLKENIGVVLDACSYPEDLTVAKCAKTMKGAYPTWDNAVFAQLTQRFDLPADRKVKDLSRGMGMKLTLACALAHSPKLLVLDEATAGLDPIARDEVIEILRDFMLQDEERGILISSHITSDLDKLADIIVCIDAGHIVFSVSRDEIEQAGIALCRESELSALANNSQAAGVRIIREAYAVRALVPNRFGFAQQFPHIALEPANTESYMQLMMKGEQL